MDKQSLLQLLANNQLDELFYSLKNHHGVYNDLVLLESKWNDLRAKQRNGVISSEQADIEFARMRKNLLELIEITSGNRSSIPTPPPLPTQNSPNRTWLFAVAALVGLFLVYQLYTLFSPASTELATEANDAKPVPTQKAPENRSAQPKQLNLSEAQPMTMSAGNVQYERVYSIVKTSTVSTGGGKSLITLTVGLNFKGTINAILGTENFRLVADELPGPLAPTNFLSIVVDSKSYAEGDVKFELSDSITRFSVILEGKEDKKWIFSR